MMEKINIVFIGDNGRPYCLKTCNGVPIIFYWHPDKYWVILRRATDSDIALAFNKRLPEDQAALYHNVSTEKNLP